MMSSIWGAYLEDYNKIKIIIPSDTAFENITLVGNNNILNLSVDKTEVYGNEKHIFASYNDDILLHIDYNVHVNKDIIYHLSLGKITRTNRFDLENYYDGSLGFIYNKEYTIFRIWSPVCKEIKLILNDEEYNLDYINKGLWEIKVNGDLENYKYYYKVRVNSDFQDIIDPYGISVSSNAKFNYVIDLSKTYKMKYDYIKTCDNFEPFIYEINFRDLCNNIKKTDSLYLKAIERLDYIKNLNITHLQLMPTYCFGGVDENVKDSNDPSFKYNWGYNPVSYMTPSGWFSSNANSPVARINELKEFIDNAHKLGLGVNMDVVFNHVYIHETFSLGILVPGYVYRTNNEGFMMNSSYCGNDFRTEALMNRKFIIDTIKYYQNVFLIDGFRFDLMGLIDNDTIINVKEEVLKINPSSMIYGEGWYMNTTKNIDENANIGSAKKLYPVAFFNDYFRNSISGKMHGNSSFITGELLKPKVLTDLLCKGSTNIMPFKNSMQSINYIECHDNYTFYDKCKYLYHINDENKLVDYCKLGLGLVILSDGIKLIHAGQELMRSKGGHDNSYNLNDEINSIKWNHLNTKYDLSVYTSSLIEISKTINKSTGKCYFNDEHYEIRYQYDLFQIIIKNNYEEEDKYFVPGTRLIFNNLKIADEVCESLHLTTPGIWVLKK